MTCHNDDMCRELEIHKDAVEEAKPVLLPIETISRLADIFKVLGDPTRMRIIDALSHRELCVCDIAELLNMTPSAISHQLRILRNTRLVKYRKEGKSVFYSLDDDHIMQLFRQGLEHINHD
ncbi:Transcriptional repressor SmtB [Koleobacter methoxysyntrophicus]|uniref:Transcriptional repressor SmtB n=1 Tax=Koleobacter methoxysyntrophicus TaxID=2751313 RepID=A0A8A0RJD0_9FIRM|nr:metalloregulator ArsR/SmtB family transcription factor [Koleobacter methoxysyntrophicus]QSQ07750.1 Transcriptional repressor SmtB [Koleobacter methoxysyntrophicus]